MRLTKDYDKFCCKFRNPIIERKKIFRLLRNAPFSKKEVPGKIVYYTNADVDKRNNKELNKFEGEELIINGEKFKKGCPVRIKTNYGGLYNGSLVTLQDFKDGMVTFKGYEPIPINNINFKLAFALTIHSAQCKTFEGINIYLKEKQILSDPDTSLRLIYTALTRVRDFKNAYVKIQSSA